MREILCAEALALADAALDGPLPGPEEASLRSHLVSCADCAAAAAEGRRLHESLLALGSPDTGPAFTDRVADALDRGPHGAESPSAPARPAARLLRAAVAVLGTAALAAAALLLLPVEEAAASMAERVPDFEGIAEPLLPWVDFLLRGAR